MSIPIEMYQESMRQLFAPVGQYLEHPDVSEIMINGPDQVYIERHGKLEQVDARFQDRDALIAAMRNVAQYCGKHIDDHEPIFEGRLPDGSRVHGILDPIATTGPYLSIRRFFQARLSIANLIESGSLTKLSADTLRVLVAGKMNVLISGGTGTGKTSLLNLLTSCIPEGERVGVIEDSKEVQVQVRHVFQLEARRAEPETGLEEISIRDLFRASLRMRPDRIIIGEIRGGEALDIVQAMVSGHGGCMGTLHATSPAEALMRLETMAMMGDVDMSLVALRVQLAAGIDIIVQVDRQMDGRRMVTAISELAGFDEGTSRYKLNPIFQRVYGEMDADGHLQSELKPVPGEPECRAELRAHGHDFPEFFRG